MAGWRNAELESLFGGPLNATGLTEEAFDRLRAESVAESDQLDFKRVNPGELPYPPKAPRKDWLKEQEFAKDVAALANHRGGIILIGVGDANGVAHELTPVTVSTPEGEERRLGQALRNYQAPLAECYFVPVPAAAGGWYLAAVVPPSPRSPHAVLGDPGDDKRPLRYPVRHGRETWWLTEHEVAERYRMRLSAQEDGGARSRRVLTEGFEALRRSDKVWVYVAAVPEFPVAGRLDRALTEEIADWHHRRGLVTPLQSTLSAQGRGIAAPGRVTFSAGRRTAEESESHIWGGYLELHVDGSVFAAHQINPMVADPAARALVSSLDLADDTMLLVDVALQWCAHRSGTWGTATVTTGFVDADAGDHRITIPLMLGHGGRSGATPYPDTRPVTGSPVSSLVVDLAAVETVQQRLAVTFLTLSSLLQLFGMAEPPQLRPDGTIVAARFDTRNYHDVVRWASDHGVNAELVPEA